jgi:hypothetical protein
MSQQLVADGSSLKDREPTVEIDLTDEQDRMRYRCPNGHTSWTPTNSHLWCKSCSEAAQHGADIEAEHYDVFDAKHEIEIPWGAVELVE